ncbi:MAG: DoxX family membrane protein [Candidatus Helarchaeota archaeon]|nr:DoxX family membrane protein [Candidatus Helarchaeota archaeon]
MKSFRCFFKNNISNIGWVFFRLILGLTFILASIDKIGNPEKFLEIINNYNIVPKFISPIIAVVLPWSEFICGIFLIFGILTQSAAFMIILLLMVFIFGVSVNLYRGSDIECGCFNLLFESESIGLQTILRNVIFICFASIIIFLNRDVWTVEKLFSYKFDNKNIKKVSDEINSL